MKLLIRALDVLTAVGAAEKGISMQELSVSLGIPAGSTHRLLAVLEEQRFVSRSPTTRRYFLGPALPAVIARSERAASGFTAPHPVLARLAEQSAETVFLTEIVGRGAACTTLAMGPRPLRLCVEVGQQIPLHAAASARVLLANIDRRMALRLLRDQPMTPFTERTPRSVHQVMELLPGISQRGYDVCDEELDDGVWAVSSPVRDGHGRVCASLTLAAPIQRTDAARQRLFRMQVDRAATAMAMELGWSPTSRGAAVARPNASYPPSNRSKPALCCGNLRGLGVAQ